MIRSFLQHCLSPPIFTTWIVAGKGPSLDGFLALDLTTVTLPCITLNHAFIPVAESAFANPLIAHFVDFEAFADCAAAIVDHKRALCVMPWEPNIGLKRGGKTLEELGRKSPEIRALEAFGRIFYYARTGTALNPPGETEIPVRYGSAEGAVALLAESGVRNFVMVGVDGGTKYSKHFAGMTPMANGRTFDDQAKELDRIRKARRLVFSRLT